MGTLGLFINVLLGLFVVTRYVYGVLLTLPCTYIHGH